ncbi:hypothetical protein FE257_010821 [Aspergillus nanangensis]|uniref:Uncharacterized protein n=1 Tax=Aspergillus nanangensis TaxID=2582783 RepID=A0AAD4CVJ9_ASPNN|nr:hypothetical protein FE257_010821 [Aspergillus nanangensis]
MENPQSTNDSPTSAAQLTRNFSFISMLGLAFAILNSPIGSDIWRASLLGAGFCTLCIALSLAEFLSAYPNAAGQYHWVAVSRREHAAVLSWFTAWFSVAGWVFLSATASLFGSSLIMNIAALDHPEYKMRTWHMFLVYICFCLVAFLTNAFFNALLSTLNKIASLYSPSSSTKQGGLMAWLGFWGFFKVDYALQDFQDAVAHMIEEIPNPTTQGPQVMVACVAIGIFTSLVFIIALLFVSGDITAVITSTYGPLLQILFAATNNRVGAICLLIFPIGCLLLGVVAIMTTCSRMIRALGRDCGLPFSHVWAKIHPTLGMPLNALGLNALLTICCGCIYLGSSSAFNAVSSATVVCFDISYGLPILVHCLRGRNQLPTSPWALRPVLGW